jgi:nitrous oxide reductase
MNISFRDCSPHSQEKKIDDREINLQRRRFMGAAAFTLAAAQLGITGLATHKSSR